MRDDLVSREPCLHCGMDIMRTPEDHAGFKVAWVHVQGQLPSYTEVRTYCYNDDRSPSATPHPELPQRRLV